MQYKRGHNGRRQRVHREYVDVYARFGRNGEIEPVVVMWRDGRAFRIDEVLESWPFVANRTGHHSACYRVRFGSYHTELYLESSPAPAPDGTEFLRWWVYAFDNTLSKM